MPIVVVLLLGSATSYAAILNSRSMFIANATPNATTSYSLSFSIANSETLGSISITFCSNSPLIGTSCTAPSGLNVASANLVSQSGTSGFVISPSSNANTLILSRAPVNEPSGQKSFTFSNVVNPSSVGTFYARLETYSTTAASGTPLDQGGLALAITNGYLVSATVPPYLLFCSGVTITNFNCTNSSGSNINFGDLSPYSTDYSQSQVLVETNAQSGYSIQLSGNTMTSGNNILPELSVPSSAVPGQSQFGINLVANSNPSVGQNAIGPGVGSVSGEYAHPNLFKFSSGDVLVSSNAPTAAKEFTISYILNMNKNQPPGVYSTTLTYIGVANF